MRVVVDTNILVSGLLSSKGAPARIVDAILHGSVVPIVSEATFAELKDVLSRPKLERTSVEQACRSKRLSPGSLLWWSS